jgi:hypothetical protein
MESCNIILVRSMRRATVVLLLRILSAPLIAQQPATPTATPTREHGCDVVLLSWWREEPDYGSYVFMTPGRYEAIIHRVSDGGPLKDQYQQLGLHKSLAELRTAITQLPKGSVVCWRGEKRSETSCPPGHIIDEIKAFAATCGVEIHVERCDSQ